VHLIWFVHYTPFRAEKNEGFGTIRFWVAIAVPKLPDRAGFGELATPLRSTVESGKVEQQHL
jgi:hypothetical protein